MPGCPTLATPLFLSLGWETSKPHPTPFIMTPMIEPKQPHLSHFDESGKATMVDVSAKQPTRRTATASAFIELSAAVLAALPANPKGNPLDVARFAGIQAAKRTADLIPMCHPLPLTHVDVQAEIVAGGIRITATAATTGPTGVEMEALTAASIAALTVYDMTKALDKSTVIRNIQLESKSGGKSGVFSRSAS
jgi:cyclic pyranopterin monophosphate synthase